MAQGPWNTAIMNRTCCKTEHRGVAAVEMAIAMPVLLYVVLGVWEVGRILDVQVMLNNAAGTGRVRPQPAPLPTHRWLPPSPTI